jgi:hypothetical protein
LSYYGQFYERGLIYPVEYILFRRGTVGIFPGRITGIHVTVESGEVAAGNIDAYHVTLAEQVAGGYHVDDVLYYISRADWFRDEGRFSKTGADDSIGDVVTVAVRMYIDELGRKIGIARRRSREEVERQRSGNFQVFLKYLGRVAQDILAPFDV